MVFIITIEFVNYFITLLGGLGYRIISQKKILARPELLVEITVIAAE